MFSGGDRGIEEYGRRELEEIVAEDREAGQMRQFQGEAGAFGAGGECGGGGGSASWRWEECS